MANDDDVISIPEAVEALKRSGYLLEDRVDSQLGASDYLTAPSSPYPDPSTSKSRELDIRASRLAISHDRPMCFLIRLCA